MRYLSATDIQTLFPMTAAIEADKEALALYSAQKAKIPLRTNIDIPEYQGQSLYMPGYIQGAQPALGLKIVSVYPNNPQLHLPSVPATMVTLDPQTGQVSALLEGTFLTQLRTGAVQGAATQLLANPHVQKALLIGAGGQAMSQLEAMLTVRSLQEVYIFDRDVDRAYNFCRQASVKFAHQFPTHLIVVDDPNQVVAQVGLITTVTTAKQPTFDGNLVQPGTHINGVGAYTPQMCELPVSVLQRAQSIICDTVDGVLAEAGDIIQPLQAQTLTRQAITGELGQIINQTLPGRQNEKDITVFKTVGTAALDTLVAARIVQQAQKQNVGTIFGDNK